MAKRRDRKRRKQKRVAAVPAVRPALEIDPGHIRRDCNLLSSYMQHGGAFSPDEVEEMTRKMGEIIRDGRPREQIAAYKVLQAGAKLAHDIDQSREPQKHAHLHATVDGGRKSVFEVAADLGILKDPGDPSGGASVS